MTAGNKCKRPIQKWLAPSDVKRDGKMTYQAMRSFLLKKTTRYFKN